MKAEGLMCLQKNQAYNNSPNMANAAYATKRAAD